MKNKYLTILLTATAFSLAGYQGTLRAEDNLPIREGVASESSLPSEKDNSSSVKELSKDDLDRMRKNCCGTHRNDSRVRYDTVKERIGEYGYSTEYIEHASPPLSLVQRLKQDFLDSGECDDVELVGVSSKYQTQNILVCYEKEGKEKDRINLDSIYDVSLKENLHWYSFEWLVGDDVILYHKDGSVSSHRFWDKSSAQIYRDIKEYLDLSLSPEERMKYKPESEMPRSFPKGNLQHQAPQKGTEDSENLRLIKLNHK
ncbi:MAG: hypothetical protein WCV90_00755 [Candidatus Woesearchaeota archaeon]